MAFSKAERVIISRGRMVLDNKLCIASPTAAHSSCFSCDSAGYDEEPGSVMPSASAALAMVFAVYIYVASTFSHQHILEQRYAHPSACPWTWTCVSYGIVSFTF